MTQLVFVHGVATRSGDGYEQTVANRDVLFRKILFQDEHLNIHTPLWGNLVPRIEPKVFDTDKGVGTFSLGVPTVGMGGGILGGNTEGASSESLASVARADPTVALDALFIEVLEECDRQGNSIPSEALDAFAKVAAAMAADRAVSNSGSMAPDGAASLVGTPTSDDELLLTLRSNGAVAASYGIGSAIADAARAVTDRLRKVISTIGFDPLADRARPAVGMFLGDVFTYLHDGTTRDGIRAKISESLIAADSARKAGEKLVVIGHSLGGVILVDMLNSPAQSGLPASLEVDALITVGSQPGLFQALGLFMPPSATPLPKPANVGPWFNVFDPIDPLAFRADPIFMDVQDLRFDSITGLASAHTTYFKRPQFYARCRKRLQDAGVI